MPVMFIHAALRWSLIRLCTYHVQMGAYSLMLVKIGHWEPGLQVPSTWHISNVHFVHLETLLKQCGLCPSTCESKAELGFFGSWEPK